MSPRLTRHRVARIAAVAAVLAIAAPRAAAAQTSMFEACSPGALNDCAIIRLTTTATAGGSIFEIALQNLGSGSSPLLATSIYYLLLSTGQASDPQPDATATPHAEGASITDASDWGVTDFGDFIQFSPFTNNGVGNCESAPAAGTFGQMGNTCVGQFITFSFFTPHVYDLSAMTLADLEFAAAPDGSLGDSCTDVAVCTITPLAVSATPEPACVVLTSTGLVGLAVLRRRRSATS